VQGVNTKMADLSALGECYKLNNATIKRSKVLALSKTKVGTKFTM